MITFLIDFIIVIILTELLCKLRNHKDIKAVYDLLQKTQETSGTSVNETYPVFYMHFMILYQTFLKVLIAYKGVTMMLLKGSTQPMKLSKISLISRKEEAYHISCLRYLANALLTALAIFIFNSMPYLISLSFIFSDESSCTLIERICGLQISESR